MSITVIERKHPSVIFLGDVIRRDDYPKERVVKVGARDFFETVPCRRRIPIPSTFTVLYSELP